MSKQPRTSKANAEAKKLRVSREIAAQIELEAKLQHEKDCDMVYEKIKADPSLLRRSMAAIKGPAATYEKGTHFTPDLAGRTLTRVPASHLLDWFVQRGTVSRERLKSLMALDGRFLHKLFSRVNTVCLTQPFGPLEKKLWDKIYSDRYDAVNDLDLASVSVDEKTKEIEWAAIGHYSLLPKLDHVATDPHLHQYAQMQFKGVAVPLDEDQVVRGHWCIRDNWCHMTAQLYNPDKPWMVMTCSTLFKQQISKLAPPMLMPAEATPTLLDAPASSLALEDARSSTPSKRSLSPCSSTSPAGAPKNDDEDSARASDAAGAHRALQPPASKGGVVNCSPGVKEFRRPPTPAASAEKQAALAQLASCGS